jgi:hypothetical protein
VNYKSAPGFRFKKAEVYRIDFAASARVIRGADVSGIAADCQLRDASALAASSQE